MKSLAIAVAAGIFSHAALAAPVFGTDSLVQNPLVGVTCNGNLAIGVTCNNNVSLSGTGTILWDGGQTGDFAGIPSGILVTDTQLISSVGQTYNFTSAFGNYSGKIVAITTGGFGALTSLTDFLTGTFTPLFGGFDPGPADLAIAYTQAIVGGITSWSVSDTIRSPSDVPEPWSMAMLGSGLILLWVALWGRAGMKRPPRRISASAV